MINHVVDNDTYVSFVCSGVMPIGRIVEKNGIRGKNCVRETSVSSSGSVVDGASAMEDVETKSSKRNSKHSGSRSRKSKKKSRHSSGNEDKNVISSVKPLVEYSDVSSEELSSPEAGEIQSEESAGSGSQVSRRREKHERSKKSKDSSNSRSPKHDKSESKRRKHADGASPKHHHYAGSADDDYGKGKDKRRSSLKHKEKKAKKGDKKSKRSPRSHKKRKRNKKRSRSESRDRACDPSPPIIINRMRDESPMEGSPEIPVIINSIT